MKRQDKIIVVAEENEYHGQSGTLIESDPSEDACTQCDKRHLWIVALESGKKVSLFDYEMKRVVKK